MPENSVSSASTSGSSLSLSKTQGESVIAFGYIKVLDSGKKRFFVLKACPKPSPWDMEGSKPQMEHHMYMYKNEKNYQKGTLKQEFNLENLILLSRCIKKENNTVLGLCFPDSVLLLRFSSEDELGRWYFHLDAIFSAPQHCTRPELQYCFSVVLKPKYLAAPNAKHDRTNLAGRYRFCISETAVLLVKDNLRKPVLNLPFQCIRSVAHSASFFQLDMGRLSPIGEGMLQFETELSCMLQEAKDSLDLCMKTASARSLLNGEKPTISRGGRRSSRGDVEGVHRSGSYQAIAPRVGSVRHAKQHGSKSMSTFSERAPSVTHTSSLYDSERPGSQPLSENFDDYCDLSQIVQPTASRRSSPPDSATSLSANSERVNGQATAHPGILLRKEAAQSHLAGQLEDSCIARVENWREANNNSGDSDAPALGTRANSLGCRPPPSTTQLHSTSPNHLTAPQTSSYCTGGEIASLYSGSGGHREDRQVFVEVNLPRPRTSSDAARYRLGFRSRAGSHGNRNSQAGRSTVEDLGDLHGGGELRSLNEIGCSKEDEGSYVPMSLGSQGEVANEKTIPEEEDPYACWLPSSRVDRMMCTVGSRQECSVEN